MIPTCLPVFLLLGSASLLDARFLLFSSQPSKCPSTANCSPLSQCPGMSALIKDSTRHGGINLLRRSSCGFARSEPMVCCSSQSIVKEEEKVEERVVVQRLGGESFSGRVDNTIASSGRPISTSSGRPTSTSSGRPNSRASGRPAGRPGDNGSSAVRFGGSSTSDEVTTVETGRRAGEEEFSRRNGFGPEVLEEEDESGEDWGAVSSTEEEELGGDDEEWRGGDDGGEIWDLGGQEDFESYEGEDWGVQSLGTKCVTAFDCV